MSDQLLRAVQGGVHAVDLGRQLRVGMPQSPNHPQFWHTLPRRHGDMTRADGGSAANDMITTGTHVGTHIDALAHVSQDGKLHGGADAGQSCLGGKYVEHGVHTIEPMIRRGVLLDIPRLLGVGRCEGGYEITVDDLESACAAEGVEIGAGDVVLIRSGWGQLFAEGLPYVGGRPVFPESEKQARSGWRTEAYTLQVPTRSRSSGSLPAVATVCYLRIEFSWWRAEFTSSRRSTSKSSRSRNSSSSRSSSCR